MGAAQLPPGFVLDKPASFEFTSPDGKVYQVDGPAGSTSDQAFGVLQSHLGLPPGFVLDQPPSVGADIAQSLPGDVASLTAPQ